MHRRPLLRLTAAALGLLAAAPFAAVPARAATELPFDTAAFAAAQAAGKPILVHIWASWCPTCAKQNPILQTLEADPANAGLTVFKVDFDAQKDIVRGFGAQRQSTLIAFHGATETARSVGETRALAIATLVGRCFQ